MKNKSIISVLLLGMGLGCGFTSCEDMLSTNSDRKVYISGQDTLYSYWGIQKCLQNIAERQVILGEVRGDLVAPTSKITDSINAIANFENPQDGDCRYLKVKDYYAVINNCNNYLANADTLATSTGQKIMIKEYAQVSTIRAWTYLQLVNNYKEVPFYTEPLTSLEFVNGFDFSQEANKLNKDNIVEKLIPTIEKFVDTPYPNYGSYDNGAVSIQSELTMLPVRLVMGDIYLTAAKTETDYEKAAQCYYDYLKSVNGYLPTSYSSFAEKRTTTTGNVSSERYLYNANTSQFNQVARPSSDNEAITVIPSAGNKLYGNVLTGVCNVFGWSTSSRIATTGGDENSTEDSQASTSASVSVGISPETKEVTASNQYWTLCKAQNYVVFDEQLNQPEYWAEAGDARQGCVQEFGDYGYFITKQCPDFSFSYTYPVIYRKSLVWLRFAEAINRAGFPSYAFAILKDGLCKEYLPEFATATVQVPDTSQPIDEETGEYPKKDSTYTYYNTVNKNCYYIDETERRTADNKSYLNFTSEFTYGSGDDIMVIGVHSRGCNSTEGLHDTLYTYKKMVASKLKQVNNTKADTITAVEELIIDELALETAFEGNRFTDLLRVANRRENGAEWLADKIARRGDTGDININYTQTSEYQSLYNKLLDSKNWYFELPAYK